MPYIPSTLTQKHAADPCEETRYIMAGDREAGRPKLKP